jgi:putative endonuclease
MREHSYCVYILASKRNGTLYVGVTNDLIWRVHQHREGAIPGFTKQYGVKTLVYFEPHVDIIQAIAREKRIKRWHRDWKLALIEKDNPQWRDLWPELAEGITL